MEDQATAKRKLTDELIRGAFMILFILAARLVSMLVALMALFQFLCALSLALARSNSVQQEPLRSLRAAKTLSSLSDIVRKPNGNARRFGKDLSYYLAEIVQFLSYNTERKPWPFSPWPQIGPTNPGLAEE